MPTSAGRTYHCLAISRIPLAALALLAPSCGDEIIQSTDSNPVPAVGSLSPSEAVFDGPAFTLTVNGSNFIVGSTVFWDGAERATQYVSATQIQATILASDITSGVPVTDRVPKETAVDELRRTPEAERPPRDATVQVWVRNPAPGGGTSNALPFVLQDQRPLPMITFLSPDAAVIGSPDLALDVFGSGLHEASVVRWDGADLVTTYESSSQLSAVVPAARLASATTADVTVFTPAPGGGASNALTFSVVPPNPVPTATSLSPASVTAAGPDFDLTVDGTDFVPGAQVLWNGSGRPTTYLGATSVRASIPSADIAQGGTAMVSVSNPPPGGGASNELPLSVDNPTPNIVSLSPASASAGSSGLTVTIDGVGFVPSSIARWNGGDRTTTFVSNARLRIALTAGDVLSPGVGVVTVFSPPPAGGTSADAEFTVYLSVAIRANDILFDAGTGNIFASVPSSGGGIGNTISAIDPIAGTIVSSVFVGSEPNPLARSDDGQYLYVGLDGSSKIRRYIVGSATADIEFVVGTDPFFGPLRAEDIVVLPGLPGTIAASTIRAGVSPRHGGVFIYDDGVRRPQGTQEHTGSNRIEPSASAATLYGYNNETTEFGFRQLTIDASGVTETAVQRDLISGFGVDIAFAGSKVFASSGVVVDPVNLTQLGTLGANGPVAPDATIDRVYMLDSPFFGTGERIAVFDSNTFLEVGEVRIDAIGSESRRLIRVGTDGVAFIADATTVVIVRHPVLGP
ncbi:MAG: YncE family protein [bacterium]